jgi:PKD repeat protein
MEAVKIIKGKSYSRVAAAGAQDWPSTGSAQNGGSWELSSPLPPGMSISYNAGTYGHGGNNIVGTPTTAGRWTGTAELFFLGDGPLDYENFDITVYDSPIITAGQSFTGAAGAAIDIRPTLNNSTYRPASGWSATGLPAGLTLTELDGGQNCKITGTAAVGTYTVTLTAAGASGYPITSQTANSDTETITITITAGAPWIDRSNAYFPGKVGESFNATISVTDPVNGPVTSWSWEYTIPGLSLNTSTGVISGTPTTKFEHSISLTATGPGGTDTAPFNIPIGGGTPIITSGQTGSGKVGEAFSKTFSLTDSTNRPVTSWAATGLPAWASLNASTGAITGTPTAMGSFSASLTATGEGGTSQITSVTFSIAAGTPIIQAGQSASGKVGDSFSKTFSLTDSANRPVTSWVITGLPSGLSYNSTTGAISGTPTATGSSSITLTATGPGGSDTETAPITITVGAPSITPSQTGSGKVGEAFSKTFSLTDSANRPVTSWSATGLPSWATLNTTTGAITGTPQDTGSTTITLTATGPGGADTETAAISIAAGPPIIVSGQSFTGKVGEAFTSATLSLDDAADRPATSWSATGLPAGLALNTATGAITGTPTTKGTSTASFTATGGGGTSAASTVAFTISEGAPIITAGQALSGTVGTAFIRTPALTDATNRPATSWTATALPAWATLNATTGAIMGIPTAAAITTITLTATGPGGVDTETASISISTSGGGGGGGTTTPTMQLTPQQDFAATLGIAFNRTPTILSGTPTSWYATGLPAWATINATTGAITGTPNFTGVNIVTVTAQDSSGSVSSTSITLTTVSWNTLEVFIDPRARKILSRANTRSVMQKMFLKRDDLVNFQIVFVNDDQPFGLPSDFAVTVGIKASYASEDFIAFSDSVNGTLSLASDPVQDLFADEPDTVEAIFEVKWEDETSASRTASLPVIIQNTILRGNTADPGATTGGGGFTASGLSKYLAARQKILSGETAETTTLTLSEPLAGEAIFHRPLANNLPDHRGWITGVSAVSLQGDTGTEALVAEEDFVFYPDRQCFYFLNPETTGNIEIVGTASRNFINFGVTIEKSVASAGSTSTLIDTASPLFQITSVLITSEDAGAESPDGFYFDRATATIFLETNFTCSSAVVVFKDALGVEFQETFAGLTDANTLAVPKSLSAASVVKVRLSGTEIGGSPVGDFTPFAVLEKTDAGNDFLHLGWNYPTGYTNGDFTIFATHGSDSFVFTFQYWPGNAFELPRVLDNVRTLKIGGSDALVVFDSTEQKLDFCQAKTGTLHYTATHKAYEGLANGGETLQVVAEIPGVFATTAGTGHHISTLRTLNPSQDWFNWWYAAEGIYFVQIVDDKNVVIYQDDSNGAFAKSRPGYTAEELKPLTLKLPFAALWSLSPRDDTSLFQEAFTPNFATATFSSATYPELDDTQRYAAESMGAGKTITLSTNKTAPVRGVQGVNFVGPKPTYYAGGTVPYFVLATYKWFVVKCVNPNANPLLTANKNYLLCVNNTNFDNRAIMVNITNEGYNVAADLYEIKGGN